MTTIPVKKDTAPPEIVKMARAWLYENDLDVEWEDAVALEFDAAIADRKLEIVSTHAQGRPYDMPITEWFADFAREAIPREDAPEAAADQGHRYG